MHKAGDEQLDAVTHDDAGRDRSLPGGPRLTDLQWARMLERLPGRIGVRARRNSEHYRQFVEQVLWVVDSDVVWHELKPEDRDWRSTYVRFLRWSDTGIWECLFDVLATDAQLLTALQERIEEHRHYRHRSANSQLPPEQREGALRRTRR